MLGRKFPFLKVRLEGSFAKGSQSAEVFLEGEPLINVIFNGNAGAWLSQKARYFVH